MSAHTTAKLALLAGSLLPLLGCPGSAPPPVPVASPSPGPPAAHNGLEGDDQARFYHLAEGSEVYPLSWFRALEDSATQKPCPPAC